MAPTDDALGRLASRPQMLVVSSCMVFWNVRREIVSQPLNRGRGLAVQPLRGPATGAEVRVVNFDATHAGAQLTVRSRDVEGFEPRVLTGSARTSGRRAFPLRKRVHRSQRSPRPVCDAEQRRASRLPLGRRRAARPYGRKDGGWHTDSA